jgi:hypothetical protein
MRGIFTIDMINISETRSSARVEGEGWNGARASTSGGLALAINRETEDSQVGHWIK